MSLVIFFCGGGRGESVGMLFFFFWGGGVKIYWEGKFDVFTGGSFLYWRSRGEGLRLLYICFFGGGWGS